MISIPEVTIRLVGVIGWATKTEANKSGDRMLMRIYHPFAIALDFYLVVTRVNQLTVGAVRKGGCPAD